jgi:hypothetical protein
MATTDVKNAVLDYTQLKDSVRAKNKILDWMNIRFLLKADSAERRLRNLPFSCAIFLALNHF